ncbi:precorrin-6Y C5,15-methyltransferase subunit CbiT [Cylindrospermopsis raciborskii]|uniref:tRNA (guanine(46)-N(7))-methyltransferase n=1 Tax=Cylindrospermopsis raciborskii CENA302 TaxID=1170768 RepID=A0A9Q5W7Q3_9CYAN|nr:precorrin-6Y C5,15-methyltransferase subunit CbiT [Cylindrospermopsis raciborskii]NLQ05983.1 precorrin-6Y C5,15-methyltransferase subunit CbiT [Cylindrospermopsis raciborskii MVCC19]OHY32298.1 precorrin-6Y C5,15-methyltransferase (decarboxylating) subunit CbiT [Cylindrospermopsis raciborskii MVCC14]OPH08786.1 precorrin-6Y C5,15-methyltransferase (decarboxylating) subunit CbiT [Cylindrospermopsis raciborskii CENA302]
MPCQLWPYISPGIPDDLFENLPGIPFSQRELRLLLISQLRLKPDSVLWDVGAGTGTIAIEVGLLCPQGQVIAVERDEEVANLIKRNCDRFQVKNITVVEGTAPDCLNRIQATPDRVCIEGGRSTGEILQAIWNYLPLSGRVVATAANLESLYAISQTLSELTARNIEVMQSAVNRLETRGFSQTLVSTDPIFILSGEKID